MGKTREKRYIITFRSTEGEIKKDWVKITKHRHLNKEWLKNKVNEKLGIYKCEEVLKWKKDKTYHFMVNRPEYKKTISLFLQKWEMLLIDVKQVQSPTIINVVHKKHW